MMVYHNNGKKGKLWQIIAKRGLLRIIATLGGKRRNIAHYCNIAIMAQ
jgi:hypothetical protein